MKKQLNSHVLLGWVGGKWLKNLKYVYPLAVI
jgi:hypothetical protein